MIKWLYLPTGKVHVAWRRGPRKAMTLCGLPMGDDEVDLKKWRPTNFLIGMCPRCRDRFMRNR